MLSEVNAELHTFCSPTFASVVGEAISFFRNTPIHNLPPNSQFDGAGVYALYYVGTFDLYEHLAKVNQKECEKPIYIGKAVPTGWRTARTDISPNIHVLYSRLREHARSIEQASNLDVGDFYTRFIILKGVEIDLVVPVEAELIRHYVPLWNSLVDGFGNHDPGAGRYNQAKSEWDVLHPGRIWAERLTGKSPELEEITAKLKRRRR